MLVGIPQKEEDIIFVFKCDLDIADAKDRFSEGTNLREALCLH